MDSGLWSVHCCAITLQYTNHYLPANRKCYCFLANFVITVQKGLGGSELYLKRYKCVAQKMSPKICRPQWWTAARSSPLDPLLILGCTCVVSCPLVNCRVKCCSLDCWCPPVHSLFTDYNVINVDLFVVSCDVYQHFQMLCTYVYSAVSAMCRV